MSEFERLKALLVINSWIADPNKLGCDVSPHISISTLYSGMLIFRNNIVSKFTPRLHDLSRVLSAAFDQNIS